MDFSINDLILIIFARLVIIMYDVLIIILLNQDPLCTNILPSLLPLIDKIHMVNLQAE